MNSSAPHMAFITQTQDINLNDSPLLVVLCWVMLTPDVKNVPLLMS